MIALATLILAAAGTNAFFFEPAYEFDYFYQVPVQYTRPRYEAPRAPSWSASKDHYVLKLRVPPLEPDSLSATLLPEQPTLELQGKHKFEGCECAKRVVESVSLPYRPRVEDVELELDEKEQVLTVKLVRTATASQPTALKIKTTAEQTPPEAADKKEGTRPVRFVPHASATTEAKGDKDATSVQEKERSLTAKFAAALRPAANKHNKPDAVESTAADDHSTADNSNATPAAEAPQGE